MSSNTFRDRYETGWQSTDGTMENVGEYFSKKRDAAMFAMNLFETSEYFASTYVYDRCLDFTRWYDGNKWSRKQPQVEAL